MDIKKIRKIHGILIRKGLSLSVAESCTGGLISHYLTALPGSSGFFRAGVVAYSAESKKKLLGIPKTALLEKGIVSAETAGQMAERIRIRTGSDISVSITGNLGPDALENKPVGLIYIGVCTGEKTYTTRLNLSGPREKIREKAAISALKLLLEKISDD